MPLDMANHQRRKSQPLGSRLKQWRISNSWNPIWAFSNPFNPSKTYTIYPFIPSSSIRFHSTLFVTRIDGFPSTINHSSSIYHLLSSNINHPIQHKKKPWYWIDPYCPRFLYSLANSYSFISFPNSWIFCIFCVLFNHLAITCEPPLRWSEWNNFEQ